MLHHSAALLCEFMWSAFVAQNDWGRSSRAVILQTDLQQRRHPMTVQHLKSVTTHSTASVCLLRLPGYVLDFIHLLAMGVAETPE